MGVPGFHKQIATAKVRIPKMGRLGPVMGLVHPGNHFPRVNKKNHKHTQPIDQVPMAPTPWLSNTPASQTAPASQVNLRVLVVLLRNRVLHGDSMVFVSDVGWPKK
jgi:hypothetical protein